MISASVISIGGPQSGLKWRHGAKHRAPKGNLFKKDSSAELEMTKISTLILNT